MTLNKIDHRITLDGLIEILEKVGNWHNLDNGHGPRTAVMALAIGSRLNGGERLDEEKLNLLDYAARIHDLGRIAVDDEIMNKAGKLTTSQRAAIEAHARIGYNFVRRSEIPTEITYTILYHHEHWDGSGYPEGLVGLDIPLFPRITTIADVWDALISDRPYRSAMTPELALEEMNKTVNWFDPKLYAIFLSVLQESRD